MKTITTLALTLVLTTSLLVGCGCTNRNIDNTSAPTVLPTNEEIWNNTETTRPTTAMTTEPTMNNTQESTDNSGMTETNSTTATETTENTIESRARSMMPQHK